MILKIANKRELDAWINERIQLGHDMVSVRGCPPDGAEYEDGGIITKPVNVTWKDCETGETFGIVFE